jgi:hypothetical protein
VLLLALAELAAAVLARTQLGVTTARCALAVLAAAAASWLACCNCCSCCCSCCAAAMYASNWWTD